MKQIKYFFKKTISTPFYNSNDHMAKRFNEKENNDPALLSLINFIVPKYSTRIPILFYVPPNPIAIT